MNVVFYVHKSVNQIKKNVFLECIQNSGGESVFVKEKGRDHWRGGEFLWGNLDMIPLIC